ncbi:BgTH12-03109 [Blumeria graminis f. sp. triticale]|uniref:BgTH12-03109 n=1 Tax=Blumeria graminis f. sp. triticale TaxID=1689686 RepID=A0A9W4D8V1_BLUGR|nr:BgTH12-03109 [Blumeria graminis f. sp. triticale]
MVSSTFLPKDMRKLRLDRYTPAAANEARIFVEQSIRERLSDGDLLLSLKDGVALCKLVNQAAPNTLRFKSKAVMPFVQMENISLFLEACKCQPFNIPSHDLFLTVDLYELKDPAQVLQCLSAFSRAAHRIDPVKFPTPIGVRSQMSPIPSGTISAGNWNRDREAINTDDSMLSVISKASPVLTKAKTGDSNSGRWSPGKSRGRPLSPGVSCWNKNSEERSKSPAWNITQYGFLGGASQANLGVSFGGRRQITSAGPYVPGRAERENKQKEIEAEKERLQRESEENERHRQEKIKAQESSRLVEAQRMAEELEEQRKKEHLKTEEVHRKWEEEEQRWRLEEEQRQREDIEAEARLQERRNRLNTASNSRLRHQFISQYQPEKRLTHKFTPESRRIKELEYELERAREREREYERIRKASKNKWSFQDVGNDSSTLDEDKARTRSKSLPRSPHNICDQPPRVDEQKYPRKQSSSNTLNKSPYLMVNSPTARLISRAKSPRPLPDPALVSQTPKNHTAARPLPDPEKYKTAPGKDQKFVQPPPSKFQRSYIDTLTGESEVPKEHTTITSIQPLQPQAKPSGLAIKGLLEREMELDRQRQREWEEDQRGHKEKLLDGANNDTDGVAEGINSRWDVNQWTSYTGGDSQNKGTLGIGASKRQIVGPRPPPSSP